MEAFSLSKFLSSFFQVVPWMKNLRYIIGIVIILIGVYTVWKAWFAKNGSNTSRPMIITLPGSHIDSITQTTQQKTESVKKSSWWIPHLYSGVSGGFRSKAGGTNKMLDSFDTEVRIDLIGLRFDWN